MLHLGESHPASPLYYSRGVQTKFQLEEGRCILRHYLRHPEAAGTATDWTVWSLYAHFCVVARAVLRPRETALDPTWQACSLYKLYLSDENI